MESFEVVRKILAWGPTYEVKQPGADDVMFTIKGSMTSRKMKLLQGSEGPEVAMLDPSLFGNKFELIASNKEKIGLVAFPAIAFKKSFTLTFGGREFKADGGLLATSFKCVNSSGAAVFDVVWEPGWSDKFLVHVHGEVPKEIAMMATVAIHQKYYSSDLLDT